MIYEVVISEQANIDLRGIYEYIAFELLAPENAYGQLSRLEKSILDLANMPEKYRKYDREPWRSRGLRVMPVDNYQVFYFSDKESHTVKVVRVMYSGRDIYGELDRHPYLVMEDGGEYITGE